MPFGVAQYEVTVTDLKTGITLRQERWTASACSPPVAASAPPFVPK
jgi:hypothetical protein